jgi:hypothetical protein
MWKGIKEGHKISLVRWKKVCNPKKEGDLGLRDLATLNKVLTTKIWWRWLKRPKDLWSRLWRKKYTSKTPKNKSSYGMVKA